MFVLRRITSENLEINTNLGENYVLIDAEKNPEDFSRSLEVMKCDRNPNVYGFISHNAGSELLPLYKKSHYFVMSGKGETFANISFK